VTERCATTSARMVAPRASRGKSWVLAMLAPKRGLRVAPVPPKPADLTRPPRGRLDNGRSGQRNRRLDRTKEQSRVPSHCRLNHPSLTVVHPMVGETEQTSHTEIRTLPAADLSLGEHGIARDDDILQWQRLQQLQGRRDFIRVRFHPQLADHALQRRAERGHQMRGDNAVALPRSRLPSIATCPAV